MPPHLENYHLKHRKQGDYSPDTNRSHSPCDFSDEEKKDGEYQDASVSFQAEKLLQKQQHMIRGMSTEKVPPSVYRDAILSATCMTMLLVAPLIIFDGYPRQWGMHIFFRHLELAWSSLIHISVWPVICIIFSCAMVCPMRDFSLIPPALSNYLRPKPRHLAQLTSAAASYHWKVAVLLSFICFECLNLQALLQMAVPSLLWNPAKWGSYHVYLPKHIEPSVAGGCFTKANRRDVHDLPLCLAENQWDELSSGTLSSYNLEDVETVMRGLDYLQTESGGLIINALARNVAHSIPALRQNIEGLLPFLDGKELSLVIFENDSNDGTRDAFKQWSKDENEGRSRYKIDLISCGETNPDCTLNVMDRYENMPSFSNPKASGVGKLGDFRQIVINHILETPAYDNYSHMIVLDVDIGTSISPLGLIHTLGLNNAELSQKYVIASSSEQLWPGTFGTMTPPYDFSAFRPLPTERNKRLRNMHKSFCEVMPAGDRWRNMCEASSPMQLMLVQSNNDEVVNHGDRPYEVASAFNGVTIYPLSLIRDKGDLAHYDAGDDNQRCEHVGFNLSLQDVMYINPKWKMILKPNKPGGPTGLLVTKTIILTFAARIPVLTVFLGMNYTFMLLFVILIWTFGFSMKRAYYSSVCPRAAEECWDEKDYGRM
ncbi:hypothetical protein ACHAWO_003586 [Cyclotella atomus]|uniref:Glycosyltransferase family 69 protein n=1 Tax=Cyclotella atomus TaxID=382360 RepID=A0ABD3QU14_9STRA